MSVIVTDTGFTPDDWTGPFVAFDDDGAEAGPGAALDVPSSADAGELGKRAQAAGLVRIDFPSFSDGRGFTLAAALRRAGYTGRLRAHGHVIADQYAMARRAGFDEVEISDELATRQPEDQWKRRADWRAHDYQSRLRGTPA
ncbi:DUF934 domain-containing protein [Pelagovum pacificum]|uniref:DUF934 domain-containing protein n=1 Tax=Pelagovum pacificum TaxID=2588711 RepID=A0A5C5GCW1_9RHOB|nr:DUF934 domain-containing protein [Pelagovum pacificum]QQA41208.1 DUF934 domain-containing protein [Pelagovum pacificum]TNY31984.1 DUF934 domain-containing protein [Pelagovum pacificum]